MESMTEGGAKTKTKGALEGAKEKLTGGGDDDDDKEKEKKPTSRRRLVVERISRSRSSRSKGSS